MFFQNPWHRKKKHIHPWAPSVCIEISFETKRGMLDRRNAADVHLIIQRVVMKSDNAQLYREK